jgi:Domain of unknown function (DUF4340)
MRQQLLVNGALVVLALGTLGVVWVTREAPTTADLASRKDKLFVSFRKDAVSRIVLSQAGRELVLEASHEANATDDYRIVKPWPERADIASVNQLLGSLDLASALRAADGVSTEQAGLDASALQIRLEMAGKVQTVTLGGPAPSPAGARYAEVKAGGTSKRYVVSQGVAAELSVSFDKFREPRLLEYGRSEISRISLGRGMAHIELTLGESGTFFTLVNGDHELARHAATDRLLSALSRLATEQFVEVEQAREVLSHDADLIGLTLVDKAIAPVGLSFAAACPKDPSQALVLLEQAGRPARAGCVAREIEAALHVSFDELRVTAPFAARPDEIEELRVVRGSQKLELARKDKAFVLRAPGNSEVPLDAGNERISAITEARGDRPEPASLAELGLEPPAGEISIQIAGADEASHRSEKALVGKPRRDGSVCIKRTADGVVLCFSAQTAHVFEPDATLLKGLTLFSFAPSELSSFSIDAPGLHEAVQRHDDGTYDLTEPKGFVHDGSQVADVVQTLGTLQAAHWVAAADAPSLGLAAPRLRVSITLGANAGTRELLVGAATPGGYFARVSSDPGVFVLARSVFAELSAPLIDRALTPFAESELGGLSVRSGNRTLSFARPDQTWVGAANQPTQATILLEPLSALRAEFAVHLGAAAAAEGFAKPSSEVTFVAKNGKRVRLLIGTRDTLNDTPIAYARRDDVDATFALAQRTAASLQDFGATEPQPATP